MSALTEGAQDILKMVSLSSSSTAALLLYSSHTADLCLSCHIAISDTSLANQQQHRPCFSAVPFPKGCIALDSDGEDQDG